jgi:hypothetical protein
MRLTALNPTLAEEVTLVSKALPVNDGGA